MSNRDDLIRVGFVEAWEPLCRWAKSQGQEGD